jgi:hypothetical protein
LGNVGGLPRCVLLCRSTPPAGIEGKLPAMSSVRRLLLAAILLVSSAAAARNPKLDAPTGTVDPSTRCNLRCMEPFNPCRKKCNRSNSCVSKCSSALTKCTDRCGGPPARFKAP